MARGCQVSAEIAHLFVNSNVNRGQDVGASKAQQQSNRAPEQRRVVKIPAGGPEID